MDKRVKGIVLKSSDSKEADKLLTLLTCEDGKITVLAKSVKKAKAKLKFATELFCFGEFELAEGKGIYILTGCELFEQFYDLRLNLDAFYLAGGVLDIFDNCTPLFADHYQEVSFIATAFSEILRDGAKHLQLSIKLCFELLKKSGYGFTDFRCGMCREQISGKKAVFSAESEGFFCENCGADGVEMDIDIFNTIKSICTLEYEDLAKMEYEKERLLEALRFFLRLIKFKFAYKPKALIEFGKLQANLAI